ncbi:MAG: CotH kinase family protein [Ruminococcus sp.]|nr:CotH kinase family protein [Ruminococcus sp.]
MKKFISLLVMLCMLITIIPFATTAAEESEIITPPAVEVEDTLLPNPQAYPNFATDNWEALYAHATLGGDSDNAWQKWMKDYTGINAEEGVRYFFLPKSADDELIEIYNGYIEDALVGDVIIPSHTSAFVEYTEDTPIPVEVGTSRSYTVKVLRSDSEAALYINDTTNSYEDFEGNTQETDLWSFLIQNKENSCSTATYSIVNEEGVEDGNLKKIKGRGNTNWKESDKKPFNINFNDKVTIGHTESKKFSLVANPKDSTMLRNTIMYNLAHDVGNPYSSDQSFIDFFVNGVYRGTYIACQKIELGKNSVVSLKDDSEDKETDFNFLVEVDVWNYKNDTYFTSDKGYHVVIKTPDSDDFDTNSDAWNVRYNYIKDTYQKLEDALYKGTLADIEAICDIESLATQYLLQDLGKNCDGGYTSTFFTYNAAEGKFYAAPIWDCDSHLGAVDVWRDGCSTSTSDHRGWTTKLAKYERTINPLGQPFYVKGTTSKGQTFDELCKDIWTEKFLPKIDVLLGKAEPAEGDRGMSIDAYAKSIEKTSYINYIMWDFMWLCQDKNKSLTDVYTEDVAGELQYMKDWLTARTEWITANIGTGQTPVDPPSADDERVVYFSTDLEWTDVHYYIWGDGHIPMRWPGEKAEKTDMVTEFGETVYKITINDSKANMIIFNDGANGAQTEKTQIPNTPMIFSTTEPSGRINEAGQPYYNVSFAPFTAEEPSSSAPTQAPSSAIPTMPNTAPTVPSTAIPSTPDDKPTLPSNTISAFVFDNTGKEEGEKLEEYGSKEGYAATFGNGTLTASVNSDGYRALEWSAAEYGDNEEMVPIVSAGNKNPWGDNPYVQITLSTKGYKNIKLSLTSAGSKKCPASWQLAYSLDSEAFTDVDGVSFTIASENRKDLIAYLDNQLLPDELSDKESVTIRLYAVSSSTINGGTTADDPTGGELVINNIIVTGDALTPEVSYKLGDADLNGSINVKDATAIQKHLADLIKLDDIALGVCDTNRDTKITVSDATTIQKFIAGIIFAL